ncbi:hypothetical protein [Deinococcus sp. PESE-13]
MQRLLMVGTPGAGQSTLAKKLAERTGLPLTHLDELSWDPGWVRLVLLRNDAELLAFLARLPTGSATLPP